MSTHIWKQVGNKKMMQKLELENVELKEKLAELSDRMQCKICREAQVCAALNPCGHVFCNECAQSLKRSGFCYTCRRPVQNMIKIYL